MRLGLYVIALLILLTTAARADPTPTLRKWREFVYGKVAYDGVEYFNFDVTEEAFRVILTVDLGDVGDMVGPTMLIKYGSFPTTSDFDQRVYLNASTTFYSVQVDNLRVGRYFITLVGSLLYGSIQDFVGHQSPLFFFLNAYYFGCSDPTRTGAKCVIPLLMADPPVTPTTLSVASNYASNTTNTGCLDTTNRVLYYVVEIPAPEWDLVLTLITSSSLDMTISAGANIRDPASFNTENLSQSVTAKGGDQEHSVDLQVLAPLAGAWMVMVSGGIPTGASCKQGSGVTFQFIAKHTRDCSHTDGAVLPSPDTNLSPLNLCDVSFTPLSEIRYEPFKDDGVVLTTDFKADEPITGGGDGESTVATTQPVTGYTVHVPKIYAGANLIVEALVTANVQSFQVYARVNGLPTPSVFDYHFNSSNASRPTQANDTSSDSTFDVLQYTWNPVVFPKTGQWNMIVIADGALALLPHQTETKNSSFWAIDLSLHTYACPADKACSGHGDCELAETYQGLHYGACSCHYGFGGEQCDTLSLDPSFRTHQILMLLLSNAAIIPVVIVCCRRKLYLESVLFFMAGLTSAVYHACDVELKCFFPYKFLQEMDFALAFNMIMMLTVHFSGARKQAKAGIEICLLILTIVLASNKTTSMANWVFIGMFCVLQFSVTLVYYFVLGSQRMGLGKITALRAFLFQSNNFDPRYGIVGLVLWIVALSCWFTSSATNYWLVHSIWHMGAMLAAACLIGFRRNDRYQMLTPVTGVDVLGPNYNETKPTTIGLKQMTDSKVITVSSENETSSAEPTVAEEA